MRALTYEKHGDPRDGVVKSVFDPRPGPGQILVRVVAAGLNPADVKIVEGKISFLTFPKRPFVPGCEAAGVVEALDPRVSGLREGDVVALVDPEAAPEPASSPAPGPPVGGAS